MGFVVIRHPHIGLGTCPADAAALMAGGGWVRVSDERPDPSYFHLPDYADASPVDAEAPEPEPESKPAKTTKESKS